MAGYKKSLPPTVMNALDNMFNGLAFLNRLAIDGAISMLEFIKRTGWPMVILGQ